MVKCFCLVGLPGSGKSTYAKKLAKEYSANIHSSDAIREELTGDINNQNNNDEVFKILHRRIKEDLINGVNCIYDACNIRYKSRMEFVKSLNNIPCEKIAVLIATPYEVCIERNEQRERNVPEEVIERMHMNFWVPAKYEGFDDVRIEYGEFTGYYGLPLEFYEKYKCYDQHNKHHSLTLGEHCRKAARYLYNRCDVETYFAAFLHDCGKPFCATFLNKKGEITEECHYYGHEHVSSYMSLFYDYADIVNPIDVAIIIVWHMRPYIAWKQSGKAMQKDRKLLGEELFNEIVELNKADIASH